MAPMTVTRGPQTVFEAFFVLKEAEFLIFMEDIYELRIEVERFTDQFH